MSSRAASETGHRDCARPHHSGLVQQSVHSSQKGQAKTPSYPRPQATQQVPSPLQISNGDSGIHSQRIAQGRVGHIVGPLGRLLSHTNTCVSQEVSSIPVSRSNLSVHMSASGTESSSLCLFEDHSSTSSPLSSSFSIPTPIPRRLASQVSVSTHLSQTHPICTSTSSGLGLVSSSGEVRTHSISTVQVPRISIRPSSSASLPHIRSVGEASTSHFEMAPQFKAISQEMARTLRSVDINGEESLPRYAQDKTSSGLLQSCLQLGPRGLRYTASHSSGLPGASALVAKSQQCDERDFSSLPQTRGSSVHGRIARRLGSPPRGVDGVRPMVISTDRMSHQLPGTTCSTSRSQGVPVSRSQQISDDCYRQHHCCSVYKQDGRHPLDEFASPHLRSLSLGRGSINSSQSSSHSWLAQCDSRPIVTKESGDSHRMVSSSSGVPTSSSIVAEPSDRSLCHEVQSPTSGLRISNSRPSSIQRGRTLDSLGSYVRLRVPTISDHISGASSDSQMPLPSSVDSPELPIKTVVSSATVTTCGQASSSTITTRSSEAASQHDIPSQSEHPETSRLAALQRSFRSRGFSTNVTHDMSQPQKSSTVSQYDYKWKRWCSWCRERQIDPESSTIPRIADFVFHLHHTEQKAYKTIQGYVTSISRFYKSKFGLDVGHNQDILDLIHNYKSQEQSQHALAPDWDLSRVLNSFTKAPYEPMNKSSIFHLTTKTVFLIALASSSRVSELHALIRQGLEHPEKDDWSTVVIKVDPSFIAKTEISPTSFTSVTIPALSPILSAELKEERVLCPIRALRYYIEATDKYRGNRRALFLPMKKKDVEIGKHSISRWIRDAIRIAYAIDKVPEPQNIRAHDTRKLSTSWSVYNQIAVEDILKSCMWKHKSTFISHYLKNMSRYSEDMYRLGPVVTSQHVVQPRQSALRHLKNKSSKGRDTADRDPPNLPVIPQSHTADRENREQQRDRDPRLPRH